MGWYARKVLPGFISFAMRQKPITSVREKLIPMATGNVLEVGFGPGMNLPFYGDEVRNLVALDPSEELRAIASESIAAFKKPFEFIGGQAEDMPFEDRQYDSIVCTWTLCSATDPVRALGEMRRTLKPGGVLIFAEHGQAPDSSVQRWQAVLNPLWKRIAGGCNLNRPTLRLLESAGFRLGQTESSYLPGPRPLTYTHRGIARPI